VQRRLVLGAASAAALALASTALLPAQPTYDPWAWAVWGRELVQGSLDTSAGPSWKPLPPIVIAALSPLRLVSETLPATVWVLAVRFAAIVGIVLTARLAVALARFAWPERRDLAVPAALLAAAALLAGGGFLRYFAAGSDAPLAMSFAALGALALLSGRPRLGACALALLVLVRPEATPIFAFVAWRAFSPRAAAAALAAMVALWTVPEWVGSGDPLGAFKQAASRPSWAASNADDPVLASLGEAARLLGPVTLAGLVAASLALLARRTRATGAARWLLAITFAWVAAVAASTALGFSGNARYYAPIVPLAAALAAVGLVQVVAFVDGRSARLSPLAALVPGAGLLVAGAALVSSFGAVRERMDAEASLARALAAAPAAIGARVPASSEREGLAGARRLIEAGTLRVDRPFQTHAAYILGVPIVAVERPRRKLPRYALDHPRIPTANERRGSQLRASLGRAARERWRLLATIDGWRIIVRSD